MLAMRVIIMVKSRRKEWARYLGRKEECGHGSGRKIRKKEPTRKRDVCGIIILKLILEK
jgi:hypothetical protein